MGKYYARFEADDREMRRSLDTNDRALSKRKLADLQRAMARTTAGEGYLLTTWPRSAMAPSNQNRSCAFPIRMVHRDMTTADLRTHLDGEGTFLGLCSHTPPDTATFARLLANAALASCDMQRAVPTMTVVTAGLAGTRKPVLLLYGAQNALQAKPTIAHRGTEPAHAK